METMDDSRSAMGLGVVALLGLSAPTFALVVSLVAFLVAVHALRKVNFVVRQLESSAEQQATEISELVADPLEGGGTGDG